MYKISRLLARIIFAFAGPLHVLGAEHSRIPGSVILAANHISHFDPPIISVASARMVHWMAMAELFEHRWGGAFLRQIGVFPTNRERPDRASVKTAIARLQSGAMLGMFPEGGIRAGATSLLEGAPLRPGVAALAVMANAPVMACVILGSDRLYDRAQWLPWRRSPLWVGFAEPIRADAALPPREARELLERHLARSLRELYEEMQRAFSLLPDDLPKTPQRRKGRE